MKYFIYLTVIFFLLLLVSYLLTRFLFRGKKIGFGKKLLVLILIQSLLVGITSLISLLPHYEASETALQYLHSEGNIEFADSKDYYAFRNPGSDTAVIFYPGSKVDEYAYSFLSSRIAADGADVYVIKSPFCFPLFNPKGAERILQKTDYERVYIGGHSLGGYIASKYVCDSGRQIDGLFLLGAYPSGTIDDGVRFLSIYGTEDGILDRNSYETHKEYWPKDSKETVIEGGNHSCYADYGLQKNDHEALIDRETQMELTHRQITDLISE